MEENKIYWKIKDLRNYALLEKLGDSEPEIELHEKPAEASNERT